MNKAIFLDRDGVLIEDCHYNCNLDKIKIRKDILRILKELQREYLMIIITNQSGVARGFFSLQDVYTFNNAMIEKCKKMGLTITDVFVCPHFKDGKIKEYSIECDCRKPHIGMILNAKLKYDLDLKKSFLIGDKDSDIQCGINAGLKMSFNINQVPVSKVKSYIIQSN